MDVDWSQNPFGDPWWSVGQTIRTAFTPKPPFRSQSMTCVADWSACCVYLNNRLKWMPCIGRFSSWDSIYRWRWTLRDLIACYATAARCWHRDRDRDRESEAHLHSKITRIIFIIFTMPNIHSSQSPTVLCNRIWRKSDGLRPESINRPLTDVIMKSKCWNAQSIPNDSLPIWWMISFFFFLNIFISIR